MIETLKKTPLYDFHVNASAKLVPFAGWLMPIQYTSIVEEHLAVRNYAGLFDVSHMGEVKIKGPQAAAFLDYLLTNKISGLKEGRAVYSLMCNAEGGVVDDVIVYCTGIGEYLLCVNASNTEKDIAWILDEAVPFDCLIEDVSLKYAQLALQGPKAEAILSKVSGSKWDKLARFHFVNVSIEGIEVMVSRTGYTGEDGFELYLAAEDGSALAELIYEAGLAEGLKLAGLGARDSLRLEAGYSLYGHEISEVISPLAANLEWVIKWNKKVPFIGQEILEKQKQKQGGLDEQVVFFIIEDRRIAREGADVFLGDEKVGRVLSGTFSPVLNKAIGSALIKSCQFGQDNLTVDIRGTRLALSIKRPPLHK